MRAELQDGRRFARRRTRQAVARRPAARVVDHDRRLCEVGRLRGARARDAEEEAVVDLVEVRARVVTGAVLEVVRERLVEHGGTALGGKRKRGCREDGSLWKGSREGEGRVLCGEEEGNASGYIQLRQGISP